MIRVVNRAATLAAIALGASVTANATWSIIVIDTASKEIAIGSATCLVGTNLKGLTPVVLVDVGAAAAQSTVDRSGTNRNLIWNEFLNQTDPNQILHLLEAQDSDHQMRQYGIVDVRGRAATFTGTGDGAFAGGFVGRAGTLVYAIQGNVLTGQPVIDEAERALLETPGGLPEKLMAAMEAAYAMGGDGRCSCNPRNPTRCGSPPPRFTKSAHVGFMIGTRRGDNNGDTTCTDGSTCAGGNYYMKFNVKGQRTTDPDPVLQMRERFDLWRATLVGTPDAVESGVQLSTNHVLNDGASTLTMQITLRDWQGLPATDILDVAVAHDPLGSAGSSIIGPMTNLGNGVYEVTLTAGTTAGRDRLAVTVTYPDDADADSEDEQIVLIPSTTVYVQDARADLNHDQVVDLADLVVQLSSFGSDPGGDIDGDGDTDLRDLAALLASILPKAT